MIDHGLRAIYEYLSAIPCNPGKVIAGASYLQNVNWGVPPVERELVTTMAREN